MFSLSRHQKKYFLNEDVGEIYIYYKDIEILFELIENYPNKQILIILPKDDTEQIDYLFISACASRARVECECNTFTQMEKCKSSNINFCSSWAPESFYSLNQLIKYGVSSVYIGGNLFFNFDKISNLGITVRLIPNAVNNNAFKVDDGVCSAWIRPEDIHLYGENVIFRFNIDVDDNESAAIQERSLYNVYRHGKWIGELGLLIHGLGTNCNNGLIDDNFGQKRLNCRQICQDPNKQCNFCRTAFSLSQTIKKYN